MTPFNEFKGQINEIIKIIDKPVAVIDKQVKEAEEKKKADKLAAISGYWKSCEKPFEIKLEKVLDQKWLNSSVSLKSIYGAIDVLLEGITKDLATIQNLPEFSFEAVEVYKTTLDLGKAIQEGQRLADIQKRKAEAERQKAEAEMAKHMNPPVEECNKDLNTCADCEEAPCELTPPVEVPAKQWVSFKALLSVEDATALKEFFESRNIQFDAI